MDTILHGLWGLSLARLKHPQKKFLFLGFIIGMLPDILGVLPWIFFQDILSINSNFIPKWTVVIYNSTHSFFSAAIIFLLIYFINKKFLFLGIPYLWHIILDLPMHCAPGNRIFFPLFAWSYCSPLVRSLNLTTIKSFITSPMVIAIEAPQYLFLILFNMFSKKASSK